MLGISLKKQNVTKEIKPVFYSLKEAVFPFIKFQGVDPILGPEMRSTGEVMGVGSSFGAARYKTMLAANYPLPTVGKAFLSVRDADKQRLVAIAKDLLERGFTLIATHGTQRFLAAQEIECEPINKVMEGRPHIVDLIKNDEIRFIVNTTEGRQAIADSFSIRRETLQRRIPYSTTLAGAHATLNALDHRGNTSVNSLQQLHKTLTR
jgi:carbamoyl-phosphate synthase large subunit